MNGCLLIYSKQTQIEKPDQVALKLLLANNPNLKTYLLQKYKLQIVLLQLF